MDDGFVLFNSISVISGRWKGEHEWLYAMKRHLDLERILPPVRPCNLVTSGSANRSATWMLQNSVNT